jgi:hypothetical protein
MLSVGSLDVESNIRAYTPSVITKLTVQKVFTYAHYTVRCCGMYVLYVACTVLSIEGSILSREYKMINRAAGFLAVA